MPSTVTPTALPERLDVAAAVTSFVRDELTDALEEITDRVPLGFADFPAAASVVRRAAGYVNDVLVFAVPDDICGDIDLLEIVTDLNLIADRLQNRSAATR